MSVVHLVASTTVPIDDWQHKIMWARGQHGFDGSPDSLPAEKDDKNNEPGPEPLPWTEGVASLPSLEITRQDRSNLPEVDESLFQQLLFAADFDNSEHSHWNVSDSINGISDFDAAYLPHYTRAQHAANYGTESVHKHHCGQEPLTAVSENASVAKSTLLPVEGGTGRSSSVFLAAAAPNQRLSPMEKEPLVASFMHDFLHQPMKMSPAALRQMQRSQYDWIKEQQLQELIQHEPQNAAKQQLLSTSTAKDSQEGRLSFPTSTLGKTPGTLVTISATSDNAHVQTQHVRPSLLHLSEFRPCTHHPYQIHYPDAISEMNTYHEEFQSISDEKVSGSSISARQPTHAFDHLYSSLRLKPPTAESAKSRSTWKDADRPKRPLTAYNIFFQHERARILLAEDICDKGNDGASKLAGHKGNDDTGLKGIATTNPTSPPSTHLNNVVRVKQPLGFAELSRIISKNWKSVDDATRVHYQMLANQDKERYTAEKASYLKRT